ncbi:hypothetical protein ACS15_2182 [Ralstonia insidiosa]|uniref:Uncharacterized protein n=1 Tax=Ralstonia insidiosa TaxID=190721 RepID=A0AAC9FR65_9RALS|nr:hypothetical protein ACS15_2182 [Ralstonia insidiosa]
MEAFDPLAGFCGDGCFDHDTKTPAKPERLIFHVLNIP